MTDETAAPQQDTTDERDASSEPVGNSRKAGDDGTPHLDTANASEADPEHTFQPKAPPVTFGARLAGCGFLLLTALGLLVVWSGSTTDTVAPEAEGSSTPTATPTPTQAPSS